MFYSRRICENKTWVFGPYKHGRVHFALLAAILSIGILAALLGATTASADDEGKPAALSYQVSEDGDISVTYGAGHTISTDKDLVDVPLMVPKEAADAIGSRSGYDIDYIIVVKKDDKLMNLMRCHCHRDGTCHCH